MAKKKKPYKYLKLYHKLIETGLLEYGNGLCTEFYLMGGQEEENLLSAMFEPNKFKAYWADDDNVLGCDLGTKFNPLRQNIVLLMAAMNGEL